MELKEKLTRYKQAKAMSETDLSEWDRRTIMGVSTAKAQALKDLDPLRAEYNKEVVKSFVKVFLVGDQSKVEKFAAFASTEGALTVDGSELYRNLARPVEDTIDHRRRTFDTSQVVRLYQELADFAQKFGIKEMPEPKVDANDYNGGAPNFEATVGIVRKSIRRTSDDDLNVLYLQHKALAMALAAEITGMAPVVVSGLSPDEIKNISEKLFPGQPSLTVSVDTLDTEDDASMGALVSVVSKRIRDALSPPSKKIDPLLVVVDSTSNSKEEE